MPTRAKDWFHGVLGAQEAESRLREVNRPGLFLVRQTPYNDHYIVSFLDADSKTKHYKVPGTTGDQLRRDKGDQKMFDFKNVREAVDFMLSKIWVEDMTPLTSSVEIYECEYLCEAISNQCYICEEIVKDKSMNNHLRTHRMYYCESCDKLVEDWLHARRCSKKSCLVCGDTASVSSMRGTASCRACYVSISLLMLSNLALSIILTGILLQHIFFWQDIFL